MSNSKAIIPKDRPLAKPMRTIISNTLTAQAKAIKVDFGVTTQTWKHRPEVTINAPTPYERQITVEGDVYAMLNEGTKAHDIRPKQRRLLRFPTPFKSKTLPDQIMSRAGSQGKVIVWSKGVHHPGTKARNWDRVIATKWQERIGEIFQRAIDAATQ